MKIKVWVLLSLVFPFTAVLVALGYIACSGGYGAGDLAAHLILSFLLAPLVSAFFILINRLVERLHAHFYYPLMAFLGLASGYLFTYLLAVGMGPWFGAFSFPVLVCWMVAASVTFVFQGWAKRKDSRTWPICSPIMLGLLVFGSLYALTPSDVHVTVRFKKGTPHRVVQEFWDLEMPSVQIKSVADSQEGPGVDMLLQSGHSLEDGLELKKDLMLKSRSIKSVRVWEE